MKTYEEILNGNFYRYYYDTSIKLWTVYIIDGLGNQISEEADYYQNKTQMLKVLNFKTL